MEKLNKEQIDLITASVAKQLDKQSSQRHRESRDKRLRNTKILLREYPKLKAHALSDPEAYLAADVYEVVAEIQIKDHELAKYHSKTKLLMDYVDMILQAYESICKGGDESDRRRWQIMFDSYLADKRLTQTQQAKKWNIDQSRISRCQQKGIQDLSVMLFGIVGLDDYLDDWIA